MRTAVFNQFKYCTRNSQTNLANIIDIGGKTKDTDLLEEHGNILLSNI